MHSLIKNAEIILFLNCNKKVVQNHMLKSLYVYITLYKIIINSQGSTENIKSTKHCRLNMTFAYLIGGHDGGAVVIGDEVIDDIDSSAHVSPLHVRWQRLTHTL